MPSAVDDQIEEAAQTAHIVFREKGWKWGHPEAKPVSEAALALAIQANAERVFNGTSTESRTGRLTFLPVFDDDEETRLGTRILVEVGYIEGGPADA